MSKIAFTKLNLLKNSKVETLEWNSQKIEVKQYLSLEEKFGLIQKVLQNAQDDQVFFNPCKVDLYETIEIILAYSNINVTEKQGEDTLKLYDLFVGSGLAQQIKNLIPNTELDYINTGIHDTIAEIYKYKNSFVGFMEAARNNYIDVDQEVGDITKKLAQAENLDLVKEVVTKLD